MAARVDFYQLARDPVERVVPMLAAKALDSGARGRVAVNHQQSRAALSEALWAREQAFLANGEAPGPHAERQPILLAAECAALNGAATVILADGEWRDPASAFDRAMLLFAADQAGAARQLWAALSQDGGERRIFKQDDSGRWREGR
jgi:DNA polymerase III subunit chi